jgi:hypothetical protein
MLDKADRFSKHELTYSILKLACDTPELFNDAVAAAGVDIAGQRLRLFQAFKEEQENSQIRYSLSAATA